MFVLPQPYPQSSFDANPATFMQKLRFQTLSRESGRINLYFLHRTYMILYLDSYPLIDILFGFARSQSNGFPPPFHRPQGTQYKPIKPRRRRKRKLAETDIDDVNPLHNHQTAISSLTKPIEKANDGESMCLQFMKQSNKRKRTNQMEHSKDQILVDSKLEHNIYTHDPGASPQSQSAHFISPQRGNRGKEEMEDTNTNDERRKTPYVHPYHLERSLSPQNRDKSPEDMMNELNLNGFRMRNSDNEGVSEWRESIESQLINARRQTPSQIEQLCRRIKSTSGLGRDVLMARLRRQLPAEVFQRIGRMMEVEFNWRS